MVSRQKLIETGAVWHFANQSHGLRRASRELRRLYDLLTYLPTQRVGAKVELAQASKPPADHEEM